MSYIYPKSVIRPLKRNLCKTPHIICRTHVKYDFKSELFVSGYVRWNSGEILSVFGLHLIKIFIRSIELFPIKFTKKIIDEGAILLHISIVYVNFVTK